MMISHLSVLAKNFYAGCPSCRNPPHLSGLGTGIKRHKKVPTMAGFQCKTSLFITSYGQQNKHVYFLEMLLKLYFKISTFFRNKHIENLLRRYS